MKLKLQPASRLRYSSPSHPYISTPLCKSPLSFQQLPHSFLAKSFSVRWIQTAMGGGGYHHLRSSCTCTSRLWSLVPMPNSLRFCTYRNRAANPRRINTSRASRIRIKTNGFKPFRIRTYRPTGIIHKTNSFKPSRINTYTIPLPNQFRINTYKKGGRGVPAGRAQTPSWHSHHSCLYFRRSQRRSRVKAVCHHAAPADSHITLQPSVTSHHSQPFPRNANASPTSNGYCLADQCV
jgi:hypothetical protein